MNGAIARAFDYFVVYPARLHHNDEFRAKYYGIYGSYRDTSYGLEVRSLGGYFSKDKFLGWIYDNTIKMLEFCSSLENIEKLKKVDSLYETVDSKLIKSYYSTLGVNINKLLIK